MAEAAADAAYQGAPGAFSEDAAVALLGPAATLTPCQTLEQVFEALASGIADAAVVPLENTLAGSVPGCADLLVKSDVHIEAECVRPIRHVLVGAPGTSLSSVRSAHSHPVAIAQCERFFRAHPHIAPIPVFDTAGAAAAIVRSGRPDAAAIASRRAAGLYGGVVLAEDIQDRADNATRFVLLRRGRPSISWRPAHKTTVVCSLANQPGSLARLLAPLAERGLNLCRIESRPSRDTPFEYTFHIDVSPCDEVERLAGAMRDVEAATRWLRVLGHYRTDVV